MCALYKHTKVVYVPDLPYGTVIDMDLSILLGSIEIFSLWNHRDR